MKASTNSAKKPSVKCIDCVGGGIEVLLIGKVEVMLDVRHMQTLLGTSWRESQCQPERSTQSPHNSISSKQNLIGVFCQL